MKILTVIGFVALGFAMLFLLPKQGHPKLAIVFAIWWWGLAAVQIFIKPRSAK